MAKKANKKTGSKKSSPSRSRSRALAKIIPAETTLKYVLPGDGSDIYLDIMKDVSAINRRGMNQGQIVRVAGITIKQDAVVGESRILETTFKTLPLTWVAAQAYMKARMTWVAQQRRVRKESGQVGIAPAYEDFKVFMDNGHRAAGNAATVDGAGNPVAQGEWDYSKLVYADQTTNPETVREPYLHIVGADVGLTDLGLIQAYEESRASVSGNQPNVPVNANDNIYAWLTTGQDEGASSEIIQNMEAENDSPPYEIFNYPGGDSNYPTLVDKCYMQTSVANPIVTTPPLDLMCGLLRIRSQGRFVSGVDSGSPVTLPGTILVHLVSGPKKGLLSLNVGDLV